MKILAMNGKAVPGFDDDLASFTRLADSPLESEQVIL
jgi:hypothetical protein